MLSFWLQLGCSSVISVSVKPQYRISVQQTVYTFLCEAVTVFFIGKIPNWAGLAKSQTFYVFFCTLPLFDRWHLQSELHQKITFAFTRFAMHFALHLTYAFEAVEVQTGLCNRKHWVLDTTVDFDQRVKLKSVRKC